MITVSTLKSYHHGDLRTALIEAGLQHLETGGEADISLRQLAREAGVSATAVYRHFPDKRALLGALADEGYARLGAAQQVVASEAGGGMKGFAAAGQAYVRFALENPALFRLTFTHSGADSKKTFGEDDASRLLMAFASDLGGDAAQRLALQAWSLVHGLAMLMLDGRVPKDPAIINSVIDEATLFKHHGSNNDPSP